MHQILCSFVRKQRLLPGCTDVLHAIHTNKVAFDIANYCAKPSLMQKGLCSLLSFPLLRVMLRPKALCPECLILTPEVFSTLVRFRKRSTTFGFE